MFRFIHAADIHLDSPLKGLAQYEGAPVDEIRGASRRALANLVDLAIERQVDFVLIAGDLYDGDWKDHNTGLYFVSQIVKLRDAGIGVYIISGNHDAASKMTKSLPLPRNPNDTNILLSHTRPETVLLEDLGVAIHGRGFSSPKVPENVVDRYPERSSGLYNIGILHTSLDSEGHSEHSRYAPCKITDLSSKGYDYWALGHIHQRNVRHTEPLVVYPGNIQGRHIRETGERGCIVVSVDDEGQSVVEFQPLDVFRWEVCRVAVGEAAITEDIVDLFASELTQIMDRHEGIPLGVRVMLTGRCNVHQQLVTDPTQWTSQLRATALDVSGGNVWIEKLKLQTAPVESQDSVAMDGPLAALSEFVDLLRTDDDHLSSVSDQLDQLRRKLPDEVKRGTDAVPLDAEQLRELLDDVQPLLVGQLFEETHG